MNSDRFKFRVWDVKNRRFVNDEAGLYLHLSLGLVSDVYDFSESTHIIEQCIGKEDENEKLIFEGDVVNRIFDDGPIKCVVDFSEYFPQFELTAVDYKKYGTQNFFSPEKKYEIIGNIHENPELIANNK